jgi:hypothetical protein
MEDARLVLAPTIFERARVRGVRSALLSGKAWTQTWWLVAVPDLVAGDFFVRSGVAFEPGLGLRQASVLVFRHSVVSCFFLAGNSSFRVVGRLNLCILHS